jgi:hypothetical protein
MSDEKKPRDPEVERFMSGCVTLILITGGASIFLATLFIANWILT